MRLTIFLLFILSGFAGLVYQSIWSHYLGLFLGHSAYAQTIVLIVFMGGLALGAWLASLYSHKIRSVLLGYALIEGIIGVLGLIFDPVFKGFLAFSLETVIPALPENWVDSYRWLSAGALIFPQTILLGMTFPLMTAVFLRHQPEKSGQYLGLLYFTNSLGAAIGALASVFFLMPALGLPGTIFTAGLLNIAVALVAYGIAKYADFSELPPIQPRKSQSPHQTSFWLFAFLILFASFFTGLASFMYEIAWIRLLSLVFGSTMYAFEIMLSAFIAGLAFGGLWIRGRLDGMRQPLLWAGSIQVLMGVFAISTLWLYGQSFEWMRMVLESVNRNEGGFALFSILSHGIALLIMFPATFFAGMTLPLFTHALLQRGGKENSIGQVYAINTIGAIIGILLAVHWLMPSYGLKTLLAVGAFLDILLGIVLFIIAKPSQHALRFIAVSLLGLGIWSGMVYTIDLDPRQMSSGVFRYGRTDIGEQSQVVFLRDGKTATVSVTQTPTADSQSILTNGKPDAALRRFIEAPTGTPDPENFKIAQPASDEATMVLLGSLGPAYFPAAKTAAVIGFGSGLSTHVLLGFDSLKQVETIEIEAMMMEGAKVFLPRNRRAYEDPRSKIIIEDAKAYFAKTGKKYDLIISEPSNPWISGVGTLFSQEFYQSIGRSLSDNGLLVQWMHAYELNDGLLASVFKALSESFADYEVLMANNGDLIIIASKNQRVPFITDFPWQDPKVFKELAAIGLNHLTLVEKRIVGNKATLDAWFQDFGIPPNSDFYPILSLQAPKSLFLREGAQGLESILKASVPIQEMLGGHPGLALPWSMAPDAFLPYSIELQIARDFYRKLKHSQKEGSFNHDLRYVPWLVQQHCRDFVNEVDWLENILIFAKFTLIYLPENERLELWNDLSWQNCPEASPTIQAWNALYQAVAHRDGQAMWNLAQNLMPEALVTTNRAAIAYLLDSALVGALVSGQTEAAKVWLDTVIKGQLASVTPSNRLLMALVLQQKP